MQQNELKTLCSAGAVKKAVIVNAIMSKKWNLQLEVKMNNSIDVIVLHSKRGPVRDFSTIESVLKVVKEIGLNEALIKADGHSVL